MFYMFFSPKMQRELNEAKLQCSILLVLLILIIGIFGLYATINVIFWIWFFCI